MIEINISPSFSTDSPLDFRIKKQVVEEAILLLNLNWNRKVGYKKREKKEFQKRCLTWKYSRPSAEEKEKLILES